MIWAIQEGKLCQDCLATAKILVDVPERDIYIYIYIYIFFFFLPGGGSPERQEGGGFGFNIENLRRGGGSPTGGGGRGGREGVCGEMGGGVGLDIFFGAENARQEMLDSSQ